MEREKIIRERFKVFQTLIGIGYNTDKKILDLKVEELVLKTNMNRSDLAIAIGLKNALANDDSRHLFLGDAHVIERDHNLGDEVIRITLVTAPFIYLVHLLTLKQFDVVITEDDTSDQKDYRYALESLCGLGTLAPLINSQTALLCDDIQDDHASDA